MRFSHGKIGEITGDVITFHNDHLGRLANSVNQVLGMRPVELITLLSDLTKLMKCLRESQSDGAEIPDDLLPLFKMVLLRMRRVKAVEIEKRAAMTFNRGIREALEAQLAPINECMQQEWFQTTTAVKYPALTDFLLPPIAEQHIKSTQVKPLDRIRDEKFHILWAPELFLPDLGYWRGACELRRQSVVVAYIDIDDLKALNSKYDEPAVDRNVLPRFMTLLDDHLFARGFAYRFGGDEYVVILPNTTVEEATHVLASFQKKLSSTTYFGVSEVLTVSIGISEVTADSPLTDKEVEAQAASAKKSAKDNGRNRIAACRTSTLVDDVPEVVYVGRKG